MNVKQIKAGRLLFFPNPYNKIHNSKIHIIKERRDVTVSHLVARTRGESDHTEDVFFQPIQKAAPYLS